MKVFWCIKILMMVFPFVRADNALIPQETYAIEEFIPSTSSLIKEERRKQEETSLRALKKSIGKVVDSRLKTGALQKSGATPTVYRENQRNAYSASLINASIKQLYEHEDLQQILVSLRVSKMSLLHFCQLLAQATTLSFIVDLDVADQLVSCEVEHKSLAVILSSMFESLATPVVAHYEKGVWRVMKRERLVQEMVSDLCRNNADIVHIFSHAITHAKWHETLKTRLEKLWKGIEGDTGCQKKETIFFDDFSKKVFVKGYAPAVEAFKKCLQEIDKPIAQVRIEMRFVIADKQFEEAVGVEWSGIYDRRASVKRMDFAGVGIGKVNDSEPDTFANLLSWTLNFIPSSIAGQAAKNISIPLIFGNKTLETKRLNLLLNAAETKHQIKTILKPTLLVEHEEHAEILVGEQLPHQIKLQETVEGQPSNVTTTNYKDIGIKVQLLPSIKNDGERLTLEVFVENSMITKPSSVLLQNSYNSSRGDYNYTIKTSRSKSKVMLKSGQTTLISGLLINMQENTESGIPYLKDIPLLGWLFKGSSKMVVEKQLMIFITPTLV